MNSKVRYSYEFVIRAMCAGTGLDPKQATARQLVALAKTMPENFPYGFNSQQAQYMLDHRNQPMPEEDIIESNDALDLRPDMSGEGEA